MNQGRNQEGPFRLPGGFRRWTTFRERHHKLPEKIVDDFSLSQPHNNGPQKENAIRYQKQKSKCMWHYALRMGIHGEKTTCLCKDD